MPSFADRVALITGAGNGIGRQLAVLLAAEGARVAAVDRDEEALGKLMAELQGNQAASAQVDVTNLAGMRTAVEQLESKLGPVDVLIGSAGIGCETSGLAFRAEDVARQIEVNLIGVANSIDAVLPGMLRRRQGHLAAISSLASYRGLPRMLGYCASKAGLNALLDGLRVELRPHGIAVTTVCPGWVRTGLTANIRMPRLDMMEVEFAARAILQALRARRAFCAFPAGAKWSVRLLRHVPLPLSDWLTQRVFQRYARK